MKEKYIEKKMEIVTTAAALSTKKGVSNTTVFDIAKALNVSKGHVYHYFKSKDEIIEAIAEKAILGISEIREYYKSLGNLEPTETLRKCIIFWLLKGDENRYNNSFFDTEFRNMSPEITERLRTGAKENINFFEYRLDEGIKAGEFKVENTKLVAFNIWAAAHEWALRNWFFKNFLTPEQYAEQQADLILESILVNKKKSEKGSRDS